MMSLDVLRCKTPAMVRQELWSGMLAYNLIRQSILQSARVAECAPRDLSFAASMQFLATLWLPAAIAPDHRAAWATLRLTHGSSHRVGNRPNRIEPRAVKRRPPQHELLTQSRAEARAALLGGRSSQIQI